MNTLNFFCDFLFHLLLSSLHLPLPPPPTQSGRGGRGGGSITSPAWHKVLSTEVYVNYITAAVFWPLHFEFGLNNHELLV
jgi:hypothetical protein